MHAGGDMDLQAADGKPMLDVFVLAWGRGMNGRRTDKMAAYLRESAVFGGGCGCAWK